MGVLARGRVSLGSFAAEWLFTDRRDGRSSTPYDSMNTGASVGDDVDAVADNRRIVAGYLGADDIALARQVHGRDVVHLRAVPDQVPEADAVITDMPGLLIGTQVADCVPILVADLAGGRVAAIHAGWRGVVAGVVPAALDRLSPVGAVQAWVGPAICGDCYEVSAQVREEVAESAPMAAAVTRQGTPAVDLRAGVVEQLRRYGIDGVLVGGCTFETPTLFSYRRDHVTGRQMGVIVLREIGDAP